MAFAKKVISWFAKQHNDTHRKYQYIELHGGDLEKQTPLHRGATRKKSKLLGGGVDQQLLRELRAGQPDMKKEPASA